MRTRGWVGIVVGLFVIGCGDSDSSSSSGAAGSAGSAGSAAAGAAGSAGAGGSATSGGAAGTAGTAGSPAGGAAGATGEAGCFNVGPMADSSQCQCVYPKNAITAGTFKEPACTVVAATKCCFKAFHKTFNTNICQCEKGDALNTCPPYKEGWAADPAYENITDATSCPP